MKKIKLTILTETVVIAAAAIFALAGCGSSSGEKKDADNDSIEELIEEEAEQTANYNDDPGTIVFYDLNGAPVFDFPYPNEFLRKDDGTIDFTTLPNPGGSSLLDKYVKFASKTVKGFGTNQAAYFHFSAPLDLSQIPAPESSGAFDSPIQIVNVTPESKDYGKTVPLLSQYFSAQPAPAFYPENCLAFMPFPGFPLEPDATYAAVVLKKLKDANGAPLGAAGLVKRALAGAKSGDAYGDKLVDSFKLLRDAINAGKTGFKADDVASAALFKTQNPMDELLKIRDYAENAAPKPTQLDVKRRSDKDRLFYYAFDGHYNAPNFQQGEIPYSSSGGGFAFESDGKTPVVAFTEKLRFRLAIPKNLEEPADGWPVVIYIHGTGGDYETCCQAKDSSEASVITPKGIALISIDLPLHGERKQGLNFDESVMSFNYMNPDSGRTSFRQAAADVFFILELLKGGTVSVPASISPTNKDIKLSKTNILFMGHSHGGITGSIAVPLLKDIPGGVFSGAGGFLTYTILYRKEGIDVMGTLKYVLGIAEEEEVGPLHPVVNLLQTIIDVSDPVNYAPYYVSKALFGRGKSMMYTSGYWDQDTPYQTNETLMVAAGFPQINPIGWTIEGMGLKGIAPIDMPAQGNLQGPDGFFVTAGVCQYKRDKKTDDHFVIYNDKTLWERYANFLEALAKNGVGLIK